MTIKNILLEKVSVMNAKSVLVGKIILICILCFATIAAIVYFVKWLI